jgi:hypothetical protein
MYGPGNQILSPSRLPLSAAKDKSFSAKQIPKP